MTAKNTIYRLLAFSNDVKAVRKDRVGPRIWNRLVGRLARKAMR